MRKNVRGFTIIELLVVIAIIGILTAISIFSFAKYQANARDSQRSAKATVITEALEKYYDHNGEYPSCSNLTQAATTVDTTVLLGIGPNTLLTPKNAAGDTNSIKCRDLTGAAGEADIFAYVGDGSNACANGAACLKWTLKYKEETSGQIKITQSRRNTAITTAGDTLLAASPSSYTQIDLSWTNVNNAIGYTFQRAADNAFTTNVVTSTPTGTSSSATGLTTAALYYFRVRPNATSSTGNWSNVVSTTTLIPPPASAPIASAIMSGTNAIGTASAVTCAAGTPQYQLKYNSTSTATPGAWSAWSAWSATTTMTIATLEGYQYNFTAHASCTGSGANSTISADSNLASTVCPITTIPVTPIVTVSTAGNISTWSWSVASCPAGTTAQYSTLWITDWGYNSGWNTPRATWTTTTWDTQYQGYTYTTQAKSSCVNLYSTGNWSGTGSTSYLRPVAAPSGPPTTFIGTMAPDRKSYAFNWAAPSCGQGLDAQSMSSEYVSWVGTWDAWFNQAVWAPALVIMMPVPQTFSVGDTVQVRAKYICVNTTTGLSSDWGSLGTSQPFTT